MNGVTGRMGTNQHLLRSIKAIIDQGGVRLAGGGIIMPDPILVGRDETRLAALAARSGVGRFTTKLEEALADPANQVYFDATVTLQRPVGMRMAIAAKKHLYCEKPTAATSAEALALHREAQAAGVKSGVVQDKLWLPGLLKLKRLIDSGFFGTILSVRGEFGYWVFTGEHDALQRPSWNYRREDGGRHHRGHALPLAVRDRQPFRRDQGAVLPRRDACPQALGRVREALPLHRRRFGLRDIRAAQAASSATSIPPGRFA